MILTWGIVPANMKLDLMNHEELNKLDHYKQLFKDKIEEYFKNLGIENNILRIINKVIDS